MREENRDQPTNAPTPFLAPLLADCDVKEGDVTVLFHEAKGKHISHNRAWPLVQSTLVGWCWGERGTESVHTCWRRTLGV